MDARMLLEVYRRAARVPGGRKLFSRLVTQRAPYFASIRPVIEELRPNYCEVRIAKRRAVQNHIGTIHVIAICNALEMAMGVMAETSIPPQLRWIPKGMEVRYTAKASGDVRAIAELAPEDWLKGPDVAVPVRAVLADGTVVVEGSIRLWVTEKPAS
jgi:acyl-coenzyme A thioesterase PaaI-like protein